jgi:hypothetical protein
MNKVQNVFAQILQFMSQNEFRRCVERYRGKNAD